MTTLPEEISAAWTTVKTWFETRIEPDIKADVAAAEKLASNWASQFKTDFGAKALQIVITIASSFIPSSPVNAVVELGELAMKQLEDAAITTAEQDAKTVVLNAARTVLTPVPSTQAAGA